MHAKDYRSGWSGMWPLSDTIVLQNLGRSTGLPSWRLVHWIFCFACEQNEGLVLMSHIRFLQQRSLLALRGVCHVPKRKTICSQARSVLAR